MKVPRIYLDTSVFGGCFDVEFADDSKALFELVLNRSYIVVVSDIILEELEDAPVHVRDLLISLPENTREFIVLSEEMVQLRNEYLEAGILGPRWIDDLTHVAAATVSRVDAIVSWNFRHIVRLDKMKLYNRVNLLNGYGILTIISPKEALVYGND